ncbi:MULTISPECIES: hypothetical protein [Rhodovulum]|uniref:Holin of 3TMs, for gene-transfer release n=2 Tax=Rhodovulum TaxID=34008 RepID=A0A844BJM3_9RHOB|nr:MULTISPECIES: hypothetical protein [Rhodovulum]MRH22668.1 hypothetical protein [Rhodovulum strictum]TCM84797.1 hypothetical protein EV216_110115 [Rhodovulum steppense]
MSAALVSIAAQVGAPVVRKILERRIGAANAELAEHVVAAIARQAGVRYDEVEQLATYQPDRVSDAILAVESASPELLALYTAELEAKAAMLAREDEGHWLRWLWRPFWMYLLAYLWWWNIQGAHVANAIWKTAIPTAPFEVLLGLTVSYLTLYMGGHTGKAIAASFGKGASK